jgi:hypothetical protein
MYRKRIGLYWLGLNTGTIVLLTGTSKKRRETLDSLMERKFLKRKKRSRIRCSDLLSGYES